MALVVPGGVDRSGERRIIPALLALIARLTRHVDLHVLALRQEASPGSWEVAGARVTNVGTRLTTPRAIAALRREHRQRRFDVIHSIWAGVPGFVAVSAARLLRVPSLVHVAGGELVALRSIGYGGRLRIAGRVRERLVLGGATRVTAASAPMLEQIRALGVRGERVPLGVDLALWPPAPPRARAAGEPARLVHVASLNAVKDQTTLLRALRALLDAGHDATLDVVGEDTLRGAIQHTARSLALDGRVRFHGFLTQDRVRDIVAAAHLHVVSSLHEAGPLAMLEAAVAGVPTAGTAVGHVVEWAPAAARAAPPGDAAGLARAIGALLADEPLRLAIAAEAQRRAVAEDADFTARRFLELYSGLAR